jgi:hypothetical protein
VYSPGSIASSITSCRIAGRDGVFVFLLGGLFLDDLAVESAAPI